MSEAPTLVTYGRPREEVDRLVKFILGTEGQKIVERIGYIPIVE